MITKTKLKVDRIKRQAKNNISKSKLKNINYRLLVIHQIFLFEHFLLTILKSACLRDIFAY